MGVRHWVTATTAADLDTLATSLAAENSITTATKTIIGGKVDAVVVESADTEIGAATFAEATDFWTSASHGLLDGDSVQFTAVGTGPTGEFSVSTQYFVVNKTDNTFQLEATEGGGAIVSASDSVGTWTLARFGAQTEIDAAIAAVGGCELASGYSSVTI